LYAFQIPSKTPKKWEFGQHSIGEVLGKIRKDLGLYQKEMAAKFGVDENTWTAWENGRYYPPPKQAQKVRELIEDDAVLLEEKFVEFKEKIWTSKDASHFLGVNHQTFKFWGCKKGGLFIPRRSINGTRQIYTEADIQSLREKLRKRKKKK